MEIFRAFPSDSFQFLSYSYHDKLFQSAALFIKADMEAALCFQAEDYSVRGKMDFKAVPIQLTVDLCQPTVFQLRTTPSFSGHYKDVRGWTGGEGALKKQASLEGLFFIASGALHI